MGFARLLCCMALGAAFVPWLPAAGHAGEGAARVEVRVTENGRPTRARVVVEDAKSREVLAEERTTSAAAGNPVAVTVLAGERRVRVEALELSGRVDHLFEEVRLEAGGLLRLEHDYASGILNVRATLRSKPVDAEVEVRREGGEVVTRHATGGGDTDIALTPGSYRVVVAPLRGAEGDERVAHAEIEAQGLVVIDVELRPGLPQEAR